MGLLLKASGGSWRPLDLEAFGRGFRIQGLGFRI